MGGSVTAAAYQFNAGTVRREPSGPGGLDQGHRRHGYALSGDNSYTGGTVVNDGTLIVANAVHLPNGKASSSERAGPSSLTPVKPRRAFRPRELLPPPGNLLGVWNFHINGFGQRSGRRVRTFGDDGI